MTVTSRRKHIKRLADMAVPNRLTIASVKLGSMIANLASIASFAFYIAERTSSLPVGKSCVDRLNMVLHLALLTAIAFGILWSVAERKFGWSYGAGGSEALPSGWSAVVLSLCMTLPLTFIPLAYQMMSGVKVLLPLHWRAMLLVSLLCAGSHLLIFGTGSDVPVLLRAKGR